MWRTVVLSCGLFGSTGTAAIPSRNNVTRLTVPPDAEPLCLRTHISSTLRRRRMMRISRMVVMFCLLAAAIGASPAAALGGEVVIVRDGVSDYVIETSQKPTPAESLAAEELSKYIEQMSGAKLPVREAGRGVGQVILVRQTARPTAT